MIIYIVLTNYFDTFNRYLTCHICKKTTKNVFFMVYNPAIGCIETRSEHIQNCDGLACRIYIKISTTVDDKIKPLLSAVADEASYIYIYIYIVYYFS